MTSLAALLAGVLLLVVAGVGRLPEEVGLQRISFGHRPPPHASTADHQLDDIDELQAALRSQLVERTAVERWRSPDDNDASRRTARELQAQNGLSVLSREFLSAPITQGAEVTCRVDCDSARIEPFLKAGSSPPSDRLVTVRLI